MHPRRRLPHVGLGQAELPGDLRRFDASLEGGANGVHLARRQMNDGRLGPQLVRVSTDSLGFLPRRFCSASAAASKRSSP
jgi:hypothetical protein